MKSVTRRGHKTGHKSQAQSAIVNRRASFDYVLSDKLIVGLCLTGAETKAARMGHVSLKGAYVVPKINRRILVKRREIDRLCEARQGGMTIVPTKMLTHGRYVKLEIAVGKGKKQYDKRDSIRRRDSQREIGRVSKSYRV